MLVQISTAGSSNVIPCIPLGFSGGLVMLSGPVYLCKHLDAHRSSPTASIAPFWDLGLALLQWDDRDTR